MLKKKFFKFLMGICCCLFLCGAAISFTSCGGANSTQQEQSSYTVKFELCTELKTNKILDRIVESGERVDEPTVAIRGENPRNLRIIGWYLDEEYLTQWDFDFDVVTSNMTLYAKWESRYTVEFYLGEDTDTPILTSVVKEGRRTEPCDDKCYGYEVLGYFTDPEYTQAFDFDEPIMGDTKIYIQVGDSLYYDANTIANAFVAVAGARGTSGSPTAGNILYEEKNGESYARVDFGHSNSNDPYIAVEYINVDIRKTQAIEVTFKNLGDAYQMGLFWVAKYQGAYIGGDKYNGNNAAYINLGTKRNMSEDDEWITLRFNLADLNVNWRNSDTLSCLRLESNYNSENPTLNPAWNCKPETIPNVLLIKSIRGIYDDAYDLTRPLVTYHIGENVATQRVEANEAMTREESDAACIGYKVKGYYLDAARTIPYNFENKVTEDIDLYVDVEKGLYFSADMIANFNAYPPSDGQGEAGSVTLSEDGEYVVADFGYALGGPDPQIILSGVKIDAMSCPKLVITMRNLGYTTSMGIYWQGIAWDGTEMKRWDATYGKGFNFTSDQVRMSPDSEWITYTADLSDKATWTGLKTITALRIQSQYRATSAEDRTNVWHIKSIEGVYNEKYDQSRVSISYHIGDNVATQRVDQGVKLTQKASDAACIGYKVKGYYTDAALTVPYDFDTVVTGNMDLYVAIDDSCLVFTSDMLMNCDVRPSTDGLGTVGSMQQSADGEYVEINFGYSPNVADAHILISNVQIDTMGTTKFVLTMKNLGPAYALGIYWYGVDVNGKETTAFSGENHISQAFTAAQKNVSADGEWVTIEVDVSDLEAWTNMETITGLRIQSQHKSTSETDLTNVWLLKEIKVVK